jgi:HTH-type transcriptional regulator/antitoxin HigA
MIEEPGKMAAIADKLGEQYQELLRSVLPAIIKSPAEAARCFAEINRLMDKGEENLSSDEQAFLELLALLVADYESRTARLDRSAPHEVLRHLMRARGMKPKDLWGIFGSKGIASEVLRGKRGISKDKAKVLAKTFHVSAELFI